ncbi:hypothetical protein ACFL6S_11780 [Candidatus Poribacteria bacterium]
MKTISISLIVFLVFSLSAEGSVFDTKTVGKLTMIAVLSTAAFVVKMLVKRDQDKTARLREQLGAPDKSMEYKEGFDLWRVEWYGGRSYIFRNGVLYRQQSNREEN